VGDVDAVVVVMVVRRDEKLAEDLLVSARQCDARKEGGIGVGRRR
jgi:hypothetical protein